MTQTMESLVSPAEALEIHDTQVKNQPNLPSGIHRVARDLVRVTKVLGKVHRGEPIGFSFNVSNACPINCSCYWRTHRDGRLETEFAEEKTIPSMDDESMVDFFKAKAEAGFVIANIIGGEPYMIAKRGLLGRLVEESGMPTTWITTSGVIPLRPYKGALHFVSVDGKDAETHDKVRGMDGLFDRVVRNLKDIRNEHYFPATLHVTLNKLNYTQVREILDFWAQSRLVDGVAFSTHTPIDNSGDEGMRLTDEDRLVIIKQLKAAAKDHPEFLLNTAGMIRQLEPERMRQQSIETCGTAKFVHSFDSDGTKIEPCIFFGSGGCAECGCAVTTSIDRITDLFSLDLASLSSIRGIFAPYRQTIKAAKAFAKANNLPI